MNSHRNKKMLQMVSHDLWAQKRKIVIILGLDILSNQGLPGDDKHVPVDSP